MNIFSGYTLFDESSFMNHLLSEVLKDIPFSSIQNIFYPI